MKLISLIDSAVSSEIITACISELGSERCAGAHSIFLGQVRSDKIDGKSVIEIDYSAYIELAYETLDRIAEETIATYHLKSLYVYHSLGKVKAGQVSLFVLSSSEHRKEAIDSCACVVDRIKSEVPIWGKEILEDNSFVWKESSAQSEISSATNEEHN